MKIITKKAIPRRTVLRGVGATLALPLLDGMVPALTALTHTAAKPVRRLGVVYLPNGMLLPYWKPQGVGTSLKLSPILQPLAPFRDRLVVLSNLANREAEAQGDGSGDHARGSAGYLSCVHVRKSEGFVEGGTSVDQLVARSLEKETQLASLEVGLDNNDMVGSCDAGYSCAYTNTVSWRTPTMPLMMENDPRKVFERLFGASDSTDPRARAARLRKDRSIIDSVMDKVGGLEQRLGSSDRIQVGNYLEALRDVERRIQMAEAQNDRDFPTMDRPAGIPGTFEEHYHLMVDLQVLAFQSDLTRVSTFMIGRELSARTSPQLGIPDPWHGLSHHRNNPEQLKKLAVLQTHHIAQFAYYLKRLHETPDGEGSLLDHVMITYGSGLGDSDRHLHYDLATLVAGGGAGAIKGGRHIDYADEMPLANLHLTLMEKMGVRMETFGNSTGQFTELSEISSATV